MTSVVPCLTSGHQSISRTLQSRLCYSLGTTARHTSSAASPLGRQTMAPKGGKFAKPIKTQIKRTHFVCLPLTTEDSISQLKDSLARFRQVTSIPEDATTSRYLAGPTAGDGQVSTSSAQRPQSQQENHHSAPGLPEPPSDSSTKDLRQIPSAAFRPPGTFHLTLGVMDLSAHEDMERALQLLEEINYVDLLRGAETTITTAPGQQGPRDVKTQPRRPSSRDLNISTAETAASSSERAPRTSGVEGRPRVAVPDTIQKPLESLTREISPPPGPGVSNPSKTTTTISNPNHHHLPPQRLTLTLQGLGTFLSARSSRVFFAHAHDPSRRLQLFAERVRQRFQDAGLITETRPLVLHATVANLIYVRSGKKGRNSTSSGTKVGEVDARDMLEFFNGGSSGEDLDGHATTTVDAMSDSEEGGYIWAREINVNRVRICKMGAEPCDMPDWGLEYKHIAERVILP